MKMLLFLKEKNQIDPPDRTFDIHDRKTFDAEGILEEFGSHDFGHHTVSEVHLSARKEGSDGASGQD